MDLMLANQSTIVFANSRRLAERLTARLNEIYAERQLWPPAAAGPSLAPGRRTSTPCRLPDCDPAGGAVRPPPAAVPAPTARRPT